MAVRNRGPEKCGDFNVQSHSLLAVDLGLEPSSCDAPMPMVECLFQLTRVFSGVLSFHGGALRPVTGVCSGSEQLGGGIPCAQIALLCLLLKDSNVRFFIKYFH